MSDLIPISRIERQAHHRPWSREGIAHELIPGGLSIFWVACRKEALDEIKGYICFRVLESELYLLNLAVENRCRRRGIGSRLLNLSLRLGLRRGAARAVLDVHRENSKAISFYRSAGFQFVEPLWKNKKIFLVMEMQFPESCLDFNIM